MSLYLFLCLSFIFQLSLSLSLSLNRTLFLSLSHSLILNFFFSPFTYLSLYDWFFCPLFLHIYASLPPSLSALFALHLSDYYYLFSIFMSSLLSPYLDFTVYQVPVKILLSLFACWDLSATNYLNSLNLQFLLFDFLAFYNSQKTLHHHHQHQHHHQKQILLSLFKRCLWTVFVAFDFCFGSHLIPFAAHLVAVQHWWCCWMTRTTSSSGCPVC